MRLTTKRWRPTCLPSVPPSAVDLSVRGNLNLPPFSVMRTAVDGRLGESGVSIQASACLPLITPLVCGGIVSRSSLQFIVATIHGLFLQFNSQTPLNLRYYRPRIGAIHSKIPTKQEGRTQECIFSQPCLGLSLSKKCFGGIAEVMSIADSSFLFRQDLNDVRVFYYFALQP